jgi:hypothetical protein
MTPLALTDQQFTWLMDAAAQLHPLDREPFLNAVANLFAGRREIGVRGLRELLRDGQGVVSIAPDEMGRAETERVTCRT